MKPAEKSWSQWKGGCREVIVTEGKQERLRSAQLHKNWTGNQCQRVLMSDESKGEIFGWSAESVHNHRRLCHGLGLHLTQWYACSKVPSDFDPP